MDSYRELLFHQTENRGGEKNMKRGVGIFAIIAGAVVTLFGIYHGITQNSIDTGYVLAAVGLSFTVSSAFIMNVKDSLNKRIDDLREDVKGIDQRLQSHKHH